jgi:hypothetical protein
MTLYLEPQLTAALDRVGLAGTPSFTNQSLGPLGPPYISTPEPY